MPRLSVWIRRGVSALVIVSGPVSVATSGWEGPREVSKNAIWSPRMDGSTDVMFVPKSKTQCVATFFDINSRGPK